MCYRILLHNFLSQRTLQIWVLYRILAGDVNEYIADFRGKTGVNMGKVYRYGSGGIGDRRSHSGFAWASRLPALRLSPMAGGYCITDT